MTGSEDSVVIAGAGPTGFMLAAELALGGVDAMVLERRPSPEIDGSRAGGLHSRTIEVLDQRGVAERFLAEGEPVQVSSFAGVRLDLSGFPTRHDYALALWQRHTQRILADWVAELGVEVRYGVEVAGFAQDDDGVELRLTGGDSLRARYLIGCDGGRSPVRKAAGIEFPGSEPTSSSLIAEVEMTASPELGVRQDEAGTQGLGRVEYEIVDGEVVFADTGPVRVMLTQPWSGAAGEPTLADVRDGLVSVYGTDFGVHSPIWISRFTDAARQAAAYRERRVLLAGDAAHIHPPNGGHGLNTGVQDAVNLGWKLAAVVRGELPESLLDSYEAERHPVGAGVLRDTLAHVALSRTDARANAVRGAVAELLEADEARRRFAARAAGLAIRYELGDGHPLLGRRMPDLDVEVAGRPTRVYELMHEARPLLIGFGRPRRFEATPVPERVRVIDAEHAGDWKLPGIGRVDRPEAVLVRPDGHVAWVGGEADAGLADALETWCGVSPPGV